MVTFLIQLVIAAVSVVLVAHAFPAGTRPRTYARAGALVAIAQVAAMAVMLFGRPTPDLYGGDHSARVLGAWAALLVGTTLICAFVVWSLQRSVTLRTRRWSWWDLLWGLGGALVGAVAGVFFFGPWWLTSFFGSLTHDQLLFLLFEGTGESTRATDLRLLNLLEIPVVVCALLGASLALVHSDLALKNAAKHWHAGWTRRTAGVVALALAGGSVAYGFHTLPLSETVGSELTSSTYLKDNYHAPDDKILHFPKKPRNFLHIYLESIENSYYDKAHGGYDSRNLMPDLMRLTQQNTTFSNTNVMGGPHQTYGAAHSVASMVNIGAGVPMKTQPNGGTSKAMIYPDFRTMGDILHDHGYNTELMMGADASWGGVDQYYRQHGDFQIFDVREAKRRGLIPEDYRQWWGYEDDKLYEYAKMELTRLSKEDKPFYFILENADTHFPDGYVSKNMTKHPFKEQYANVIFYSQGEVVKFVDWCKQQPWWSNTTVFINGDQRSMDKKFFAGWDPDYERTITNVFLNSAIPDPGQRRTHNRQFAPFDFFPTTLAALGVKIDGDRLGLGTNLYGPFPTLVERDGLDKVNDNLAARSEFFDHHHAKQ